MPYVMYRVSPSFLVAIQDMYSPGANFWKSKPFDFNIHTSKHFIDYYMVYTFDRLPLSLKWATVILGADANSNGKRNFSSYAEVSSGFGIDKWRFDGYIGATPWKGLYAKSSSGINNLELKAQYNFVINKNVPFPVFVKLAYNPLSKLTHVVGGCSIDLTLN